MLKYFIDLFLHLDTHLAEVARSYGHWTYPILFLIVFAETGLVVTPILPGDSLLFTAGALGGLNLLRTDLAMLTLAAAAILGDTVNYWIGMKLGPRVVRGGGGRFLKQKHLDRTHAFFEKYGGKTIILARFVPIVRTFAPFVAGIGAMTYRRFLIYNVIGGVAWVLICVGAGHLFGQLPIVKKNFSLVVLAIVFISILPGIIEIIYIRREKKFIAAQKRAAESRAAEPAARDS